MIYLEKNFTILMAFALLAFGSIFSLSSLSTGQKISDIPELITGEYRYKSPGFITNPVEGIQTPSRRNDKTGKLIINAPENSAVRIIDEKGNEVLCSAGKITKQIARGNYAVKAMQDGSKVFERSVFLPARGVASIDVSFEPGSSNFIPCEGTAPQQTIAPATAEAGVQTEQQSPILNADNETTDTTANGTQQQEIISEATPEETTENKDIQTNHES